MLPLLSHYIRSLLQKTVSAHAHVGAHTPMHAHIHTAVHKHRTTLKQVHLAGDSWAAVVGSTTVLIA